MVFAFIWATFVYDPVAHWLWNDKGWSHLMGGLDFAGGTPVHVASGTGALAISLYLRPRLGYGTERLAYKPNNTSYICLGTAMMWFGWFGFNGGSALAANMRAAQACIVTNIAASVGGLTWVLWVRSLVVLHLLISLIALCAGLATGQQVVIRWVLLWRHCWTRSNHTRSWLCWGS
jgi:Amt family ammonium transporter